MDLSAVIFVVLALAWAVYLIPKALKHHDEVASERLEESHTDRARVLSRRRTTLEDGAVTVEESVEVETSSTDEIAPARRLRLTGLLARPGLRRLVRPTSTETGLSAAGRAARKRRRVLAGLLLLLGVTWVLTWFAYLPSLTPLWPTLAVVGWLVLARVSVVRMQQARRHAPARPVRSEQAAQAEQVAHVEVEAESVPVARAAEVAPARAPYRIDAFDARPEVVAEAEALAQSQQEAAAGQPSLWDPLPLTLPTYVGKATARRTVRTIELTGLTSSGHDAADSDLARQAEEDRSATAAEQAEQRRVAGA